MELNVKDRIVLLNVLPREGSLTTIRLLRELREELSFSEDEHTAVELHDEDGRVQWVGDIVKDVAVGPRALAIIIAEFDAMDANGTFKDEMLDTYEKFQVTE
jgi:hypothetical protein